MNVKERIYQIVANNSLSVEEKYAEIQRLLHGKNGGAGTTSGGTGKASGGSDDKQISNSSSSDSDSADSVDSQNGKKSQNSSNKAHEAADAAQAAADAAQEAADAAQAAADAANKNGDPSANQKQAAADAAQAAADAAQEAADAANIAAQESANAVESDNETLSQDKANEAVEQANEAKKQANVAKNQASLAGADKNGQQNNGKSGSQGQGEDDFDNDDLTSSGDGSQNQQNGGDKKTGSQGQGDSGGNSDEDGDFNQDDSNSQGSGSNGSQNQKNQQTQQNQQNQNSGKGGSQGQQDIEDALKNLDLGDKQRYRKAKGGEDSDDQVVNGLPPGEIEDDDDNDFGGGGLPKQFDDYKAGKYIGIAYAKEVFKGRGVKPIYANIYDIPDVDPMVLVEAMLTESETDIRDILSGKGDDSEKADAIYKLLFPDSDVDNAPENLILMRNGDVSIDDWGNDEHLITKELGDEIKKEIAEMPNSIDQDIKEIDPEWGSTGSDGEIQERMKYIKKLLDPNYIQDPFKREQAKKYISKFGARIEKNSEGIIDWKSTLEEFIMYASSHTEQGSLRKNVYSFSGIGAKRRKKVYDKIGKVVIYADTSGSAYSFCSMMVSEVSRMARDCNIDEFDIHLFTDTIYGEHYGIDSETAESEDFGFTDVDSGGTDLDNVYNHIIENYIDGYDLVDDVACIIIMTDVDGVKDSASSKLIDSEYFKDNLDKMMYLIFDPSETTRRALQKYLPKYSKWLAITPSMLSKADNIGESVSYKKSYSVLEAMKGTFADIKSKLYNNEIDNDKRRAYMKRANVAAMRDLDRLDQLVPDVYAAIESSGLDLESAKSVEYLEDTDNSFYIDDDLRLWIHANIVDRKTVIKFLDLCSKTSVYKLVGNIKIENNYKIESLPTGFPKIISGELIMSDLPNLRTLDNIPEKGEIFINIFDSRRHRDDLMAQAKRIGINIEDEDPNYKITYREIFEKYNNKRK